MRSTRFPVRILVALFVLGTGAVAGCSTESASAFSETPKDPLQEEGANPAFPPSPVEDAGTARAPAYHGNPLCHADSNACMPDDDGYQRSLSNKECATAVATAADAGAANPIASKGCRIAQFDGGPAAPHCYDKAAPSGGDGASCEVGEDCAPGFDCVTGDKGTKSCRHYCCSGTCKGKLSNGSATFCDVQSLVDVPERAPVCMPLKRCNKLLGTGECAADESCTVVTEGGDTGCVVIGDKQVGQSCDESHCAAKLTCLGQPGARKCFKLCKVTMSDCPSTQACVTSAAFKDADFGICQ